MGNEPETNISVGQWTISERSCHVTDHAVSQSDKMTYRKRPAARLSKRPLFPGASTSSCDDTAWPKKAKRQVTVSTLEKWQRNLDHEHQTLTWLKCDTDKQDKNLVSLLWCSACREYKGKICSMKNYSRAWVTGSENQRWSDCSTTRRVHQQPRKVYRPRNPGPSDPDPTQEQEEERLTLDLWDEWFHVSESEDEPENSD